MDGWIMFARWQQCGLHIGRTWQIQSTLCFLRPIRVHNLNGKSISSAVLHSSRQKIPIIYNGRLSPKIAPSRGGPGPWFNLWFLGPVQAHNPNGITVDSAVFAQMTAVSVSYTLQKVAPFPKIAPSHRGSGGPSNTWFPGPTRVLNPNGISISSAIFEGLTSVTDRPTDHAIRSATVGRMYVWCGLKVIIITDFICEVLYHIMAALFHHWWPHTSNKNDELPLPFSTFTHYPGGYSDIITSNSNRFYTLSPKK